MPNTINVRLPDALQEFIETQTKGDGLYESVSEYIRDLVRRDLERVEAQKWQKLESILLPGLRADESEFIERTAGEVIGAAKARRHAP
jgi:antitoxin ParD1/3/4